MSDFMDKYKKLKEKDELLKKSAGTLDPDLLKKKNEKMDFIFVKEIAKKIFDYEYRRELIDDFKSQTVQAKKEFLIKEFDIDPDQAPDPKPGELKSELLPYDDSKADLKVPVCRKCGKPHNPFEPCFGS